MAPGRGFYFAAFGKVLEVVREKVPPFNFFREMLQSMILTFRNMRPKLAAKAAAVEQIEIHV